MNIAERALSFLTAAHDEYGATLLHPVAAVRVALAMGCEYGEAQEIVRELEVRQWARISGNVKVLGDVRMILTPAGMAEIREAMESCPGHPAGRPRRSDRLSVPRL